MRNNRRDKAAEFVLLFPATFAFFMVVIIPFFLGIYYSMTDWNGASSKMAFVGLANYRQIFNDGVFLYSVKATLKYTVINVLLLNIVALGLSLLVTSNIRGRNILRAGFFLPNVIGGIVLGYIWQFIFNNVLISAGNLWGIPFLQQSLLNNANYSIFCISVVSTWQYAGYIMMIYVAAIQGIPDSLLEAARVDGANARQVLMKIKVPLIANAFTISTFLTLVNSFKVFDVNLSLTNGGPSAVAMVGGKMTAMRSTEFLALNIYKTAFVKSQYGPGQASAVIFFIILATIALAQVTYNKRREVEM